MNIEARHISIDGLRVSEEISALLDKHNIRNYEDLEKYIYDKDSEIYNNYFLQKAYFDFKKRIGGQLSVTEVYNDYLAIPQVKATVNKNTIDSMIDVTALPIYLAAPSIISNIAFTGGTLRVFSKESLSNLSHYTIEKFKKIVDEHVVVGGKSIPKIIRYGYGIGEAKYAQIIECLKFYDEYIEKLLEKYPDQENPFYYMHDEKLELIRLKRKEIFNYLNDIGDKLIFGSISQIIGILDEPGINTKLRRKMLAVEEMIANYITFDEAHDIASNDDALPKILSKFIRK